MSKKVTVFCPRGCNTSRVNAENPWDECGSCGSLMSVGSEPMYDHVHEVIEDNKIRIHNEAKATITAH